jgi:threonine dehydratase
VSTVLPTPADVGAAAARVGGEVRRTPTLELDGDEVGAPGVRVVLKLELLQHTGSFKARGALNSVATLGAGGPGVAAASGGNHGAAVAWAAQRVDLRADVFVPESATPAKLRRIRDYGGELHLVDGDVGDALEACREFSEKNEVPVVHPYDTWETVCGAGTLGGEIGEQVPDADLVMLACGGGGLYAGTAAALSGRVPVQPVEPELCPQLHDALAAGGPVRRPSAGAAADSLGSPQIGRFAYETARRSTTGSVLVDEDAILAARRFLWERVRLLGEPAAATPMAALMTRRVTPEPGSTVVLVVSGGNNPSVP